MTDILTGLEPEIIDEVVKMMAGDGDTSLRHILAAARCGAVNYIPIYPEDRKFDVEFDRPTICHVLDLAPRCRWAPGFHDLSVSTIIKAADTVTVIITPAEGRFFDIAVKIARDFRQHSLVIETQPRRKRAWVEMVAEHRGKNTPTVIWDRGEEGMLH
ncbi:MAG: hypothetical protein WDN46_15860 [Methylocella sp.]